MTSPEDSADFPNPANEEKTEIAKFSFDSADTEFIPSFRNISRYFREENHHGLAKKNVFAAGTAPMRQSEMRTLLYLTDFDQLTCLDPSYQRQRSLAMDMASLRELADNEPIIESSTDAHGRTTTVAHFQSGGKERMVTFLPTSATAPENM